MKKHMKKIVVSYLLRLKVFSQPFTQSVQKYEYFVGVKKLNEGLKLKWKQR